MGNLGEYHWEDEKEQVLSESRGLTIGQIVKEVFYSDSVYAVLESPLYPSQYRVVAKVQGRIITIALEEFEDDYGSFQRVVTYWDSTKSEKDIYRGQP